jgi:hypothetical protein
LEFPYYSLPVSRSTLFFFSLQFRHYKGSPMGKEAGLESGGLRIER